MEELGYTDDEMSALPITVVQEVDRFGGGSVMMWAAISHTGKTALVHIPGNLTAQRYCDEILQPHVLPLMQQNGARFQHDNAQPYTARITTALLTNSNVAVLPWTSKSPDLNPIEHLWDALAKDNHSLNLYNNW
jgi:hypothetical protein